MSIENAELLHQHYVLKLLGKKFEGFEYGYDKIN